MNGPLYTVHHAREIHDPSLEKGGKWSVTWILTKVTERFERDMSGGAKF